jgi:hypothetical protein
VNKCAHEMCGCEAPEGQEHCSDFCRQATAPGGMESMGADTGSGDDCGCGHDACKAMSMG